MYCIIKGLIMYTFFIAIQYLGIFVLLLEILYIYRQRNSSLQLLMFTVAVSCLINFIGYLFEMRATTQEMALQAVKFIYVGKPYIILGIFLFIMKYYKVKCPKWIKIALCLIHIGVTVLVLECERIPWYYSSIDYVQDGYFPHLVLGKGIVYLLYSGLIAIYLTVIVVLGVVRYRKTHDRMERKRIIYLSSSSLVAALGLIIYFSGVTKGYDSTLPAYVISTTLLFVSMLRYDLLDTMVLVRESVMDDFSDGLVVLDRESKLIYTNPQVQKIYPALCTEKYRLVVDELEEFCSHEEQTFVNDRVYRIVRKEIIRHGRQYGRMYVVSDITENYQYTIELERQTVIAEQANKAKTDFLAKMSHEIRTPINSVMGMNEMILRESGEENIRRYAGDVKSSAGALLSIINEILDLSKIESGKLEICPVEYELDSLLNDVFHMIYVRAKDAGLDLDIEVQETLPNKLFGDDVRIRQILTNLLTNAVKYTPEGTVTLRVAGARQGERVVLQCEVADTGIGIREEDMPKLYASFERIGEDRNRGIEGTGLGMSIVIELLHLMGSDLQVESVYGEGSRFWFELEQRVVDAEPIGSFQERSRRTFLQQRYRSPFMAPEARILLVDDNDVNRSVFCNLLKQTEVQIVDVESGQRCLEMMAEERFDLVFLDHMMPEMDGVETLHRMKELEGNLSPDVPVIVLTANAVTGARNYYLTQGFDDFLSKPIIPEKLEEILRRYLPEDYIREASEEECGESPPEGAALEKGTREAADVAETLPELEEFDLEYARMHLPDDEMIRRTMITVYRSMDKTMEDLEELKRLLSGQRTDENLQKYRICVHSLKSSAAAIGALLLSKLARILEVAALEGNVEKILTLHPVLIEELQKHKERLRILESGDSKKESADMERILPVLEELAEALRQRDVDLADELAEQLGKYEYAEEIQEKVDRLRQQILDLEPEEALVTIGTLKNM